MTPRMLIILSPPRSFSSVVSTMIGQHPDLHGFPELYLFVADTVGGIIDREQAKQRNYTGPAGLLRALSQLHHGTQTTATILRAGLWLVERRDWPVTRLLDHLLALIAPRMAVEKTPVTCMNPAFIARAHRACPDACYLHLTRHPLASRRSMDGFFTRKKQLTKRAGTQTLSIDHLLLWYRMHRNILEFTARLPPGQALQLRGEDVLADPDCYLPQIAEWLGVRADAPAIEAMKHPEHSPYARVGPAPAHGGNDGAFMRDPRLRPFVPGTESLQEALDSRRVPWFTGEGLDLLRASGLQVAPDHDIAREIAGLAQRLGYQ